jgi:hypothetical protein
LLYKGLLVENIDRLQGSVCGLSVEEVNDRYPQQVETSENKKYVLFARWWNMIGLTETVHPTPIAQPVIPKPFPWARISEGKISVGIRKATVPQVAA